MKFVVGTLASSDRLTALDSLRCSLNSDKKNGCRSSIAHCDNNRDLQKVALTRLCKKKQPFFEVKTIFITSFGKVEQK